MKRIVMVSDATGETVSQILKAAMVQFKDQSVDFTRYKNVRNKAQIRAILEVAEVNRELVVYTLVSTELRKYLIDIARDKKLTCIDILGPLIIGLAQFFGKEPSSVAGLLHSVNEDYFKRIEAIEYTVAHDDGKNLDGLEKADLVILGISRTSKTPISIYLAHHGWRVANIPVIHPMPVSDVIHTLNPKKVIGLTIDVEELVKIRRARLQRLGQKEGGDYADLANVATEAEYANEIFRQNRKWAIFNVTGKALEETSSEIIKLMNARGLIPPHVTQNLGSSSLPT